MTKDRLRQIAQKATDGMGGVTVLDISRIPATSTWSIVFKMPDDALPEVHVDLEVNDTEKTIIAVIRNDLKQHR